MKYPYGSCQRCGGRLFGVVEGGYKCHNCGTRCALGTPSDGMELRYAEGATDRTADGTEFRYSEAENGDAPASEFGRPPGK